MFRLSSAAVVSLALAFSTAALGADAGTPPGPPGVRGDLLLAVGFLEGQIVSLEQAMPQAKFTWRPGKGVRSVSELYLHIAGSIYFLTSKVGRPIPADVQAVMQAKKWESQTTKKDEIKTILTTAFAHLRNTIRELPDADLDKQVEFMGRDMSQRLVLMAPEFHSAEHLGQAIAYARINGVVPPWSKGKGDQD
ncbi:MAG TPA: DinB family protein [Myxococcaceae bacterium]|nr:DinB family protein [Myxococcaceae bacterium]